MTGPQRSGTTIAAHIIAKYIKVKYIDEDDIGVGTEEHFDLFKKQLDDPTPKVIQCPDLSYRIHEVGQRNDLIVVWMIRDVEEIVASQKRIHWEQCEAAKRFYYRQAFPDYVNGLKPLATITYEIWILEQREKIKHKWEIPYNYLKQFPEFVKKDKRQYFGARQWQL